PGREAHELPDVGRRRRPPHRSRAAVRRRVRDDVAEHEDHQYRLQVRVLMTMQPMNTDHNSKERGGIMRHTKVLTLALLLPIAAGSAACSDFLGLEPHQSVSDAIYFQSVDDFRAAIVGVYDRMQSNAWYGRSMYIMSDIMGEDIKKNSTANRYKEFADFEGQVISGHMYERELWAAMYEGINRLNRIINAEFTPPASAQVE